MFSNIDNGYVKTTMDANQDASHWEKTETIHAI